MAFKFRQAMKIAPCLRLNVTHRGVSARVGPKGAGYTVNASGKQHISAGIPGSGIHVSEQIVPARNRRKVQWEEPTGEEAPPPSGNKLAYTLIGLAVIGGLVWLLF
ncbi:DUF4236 domain-containing protein [Mesorhizobium microcysteis]|uniref:DUF4236 domain-containing protein n=1 Tax=Neoaquamicrobium microcysteis TaxID=2682781 RepID=A0A5D4H752_9HYPH|nr:DUF4236 domain-containing protein [Mesorhizobium microcysteis]TYR36112.1 DUF4236 domain-containing protein [Mesorhizobium microcysteis]